MRPTTLLALALVTGLAGAPGCATATHRHRAATARAPAAPAAGPGVSWHLRLAAPAADPEVTLVAPCLDGRPPALRVATHLGRLDHLDAFVTGVHATADGKTVAVHRKDGTLTVAAPGCRVLRVRYRLALPRAPFPVAKGGQPPPARAGELPFSGPKAAFLLGTLTLLAPAVAPVGPVRLRADVPPGWRAWAPLARGPGGAFVAPDVGALIHAFLAAGPGRARTVTAGGSEAEVVTLVPGDAATDARFTGRLVRLVRAALGRFAAGPGWRGLVVVKDDLAPGGYAGAVAGRSVVLDLPARRPAGLADAALRLAALELAHTWRCASAPVRPEDLQWDFQGVARYLSWLALEDAGLAPPGGLEGRLLGALGDARRAAAAAGEPSLLGAGARFATNGAARQLAGAGGALLAFRLDRHLAATGAGHSLTGLLRRLRNRWCPAHRALRLDDVLAVTRAYAGPALAADLDRWLKAPGFPDPATVFQGTGCTAARIAGRWHLACPGPKKGSPPETPHDRPNHPP